MANHREPRRTVGRTVGIAFAIAIFSGSTAIGSALAQPEADADLRGEIGTLDTQAALHLSADDVVALQKNFIRIGLLAGEADGALDDRTQAALAAWQKAHGLAPTGRLAPLQWAELRKTEETCTLAQRREIGTVDTETALQLRPSDIQALQTTLLRQRLFRQAPTGAFDGVTRGAIAAWQRKTGFAPTTYLGSEQWAALRGASLAAPKLEDLRREIGTNDSEAALALTAGEIKTVQDRLCAMKFLRGPATGALDATTRDALIEWQKSEQIRATSYLDSLQFDALLASIPSAPDGAASPKRDCGYPSARHYRGNLSPFVQFFNGLGQGIGNGLIRR